MISDVTDIVKGLLLAIPPVRSRYERRRAASGFDQENTAEYVEGVYRELREHLEACRPISGRLLEIGPGGNKAVAALFAANGIDEVVCIDVVPWVTESDLYDELGVRGALKRVDYVSPVGIEDVPLPDESFDFIVSHAAFEHFRNPGVACREISRLLRPGGVTTHEVDFRNHRDFSRPLDHLSYPGWLWRAIIAHRPHATNRWRMSDVIAGFQRNGLQVVEAIVSKSVPVTEHQRGRLHRRFRSKSLDDLGVLEVFITAIKPTC